MIAELIKLLPYAKVDDDEVRFAQGGDEYPTTFRELFKKIRWRKRR